MGPSRSCCNSTTSGLQPELITSKETGFHVCTINKSVHTKKKGNLSYAPRTFYTDNTHTQTYIHIYI